MLTDIACKSTTCPADKPRARFADTGGLYLEVTPNGAKRWFWKYRFDGKEKRIAFGSYPAVKLKEARVARDDARKRPPGRRRAHRTSGTRRPCGMAAFPSVRWCLTRVPRGRF